MDEGAKPEPLERMDEGAKPEPLERMDEGAKPEPLERMDEGSRPEPPPASSRGSGPPRAPGAYLRLALWQRLALSLLVAAALLAAMVIYVNGHNTDSPTSTNQAAAVQANRDAEILIEQDQAPRSAPLRPDLAPRAALELAIGARMARQVGAGAIAGPLKRARCHASGASTTARRAFSCRVVAGEVTYPFLGVVDPIARRITYCKRDPPPAPSDNVPVSRRCRI